MGLRRGASPNRFLSPRLASVCAWSIGFGAWPPAPAIAEEELAVRPLSTEQLRLGKEASASRPVVTLAYDAVSTSPLLLHAVTRLRAELNAAGFVGIVTQPTTESPGETVPVYGRISLLVHGEQLRIDIISTSSATSSHAILLGTEGEIEGLMLQATEFLRAGLVPRLGPRAVRRGERAVAPPPRESPRRRWAVDAAMTLGTNWGSEDVLPLVSFAAQHYPAKRLAVGVAFDVPIADARFETAHGAAEYRIGFGQVEMDYTLLGGARGALALGLQLGAARTLSTGQPLPPLEPHSASLWSLSLGVGLRAELRIWRFFAVSTRFHVVGLSPNPLVAVLDEERRLGRPCLLFSLGGRLTDDQDDP